MSDNVGGPAFPSICDSVNGVPIFKGMSLRDYFAGQALAGMMSRHVAGSGTTVGWQENAAWDAYSVADAMLAERSK